MAILAMTRHGQDARVTSHFPGLSPSSRQDPKVGANLNTVHLTRIPALLKWLAGIRGDVRFGLLRTTDAKDLFRLFDHPASLLEPVNAVLVGARRQASGARS